jgi:hypothetical protein
MTTAMAATAPPERAILRQSCCEDEGFAMKHTTRSTCTCHRIAEHIAVTMQLLPRFDRAKEHAVNTQVVRGWKRKARGPGCRRQMQFVQRPRQRAPQGGLESIDLSTDDIKTLLGDREKKGSHHANHDANRNHGVDGQQPHAQSRAV